MVGFSLFVVDIRADVLDDSIRALMAESRIPGLSLAIIEDGAIARAQGYGVTEAGRDAVTADTLFQAASISKSVTAVGVMRLVEKKRIELDEDVNGKLRSWRLPSGEATEAEPVTLRRLLSHSAGVNSPSISGYRPGTTLPTLIQVLDGKSPATNEPIRVTLRPGSQRRYSGGGYAIVQLLVMDVTGQSFESYMQREVLEPLNMRSSFFEQDLPLEKAALAATGHGGPALQPVDQRWRTNPAMAAAGLWSTPTDLARFVIALQKAVQGGDTTVLSKESAAEMLRSQKETNGLGFGLLGEGRSQRFGHSGRNVGFDAQMIGYVNLGKGAVVMINANDNSRAVMRLFELIAKNYQWPDYPTEFGDRGKGQPNRKR